MRYGEQIAKLMVREWAAFYLDYERLKLAMNDAIEGAPNLIDAKQQHDVRIALRPTPAFTLIMKSVGVRVGGPDGPVQVFDIAECVSPSNVDIVPAVVTRDDAPNKSPIIMPDAPKLTRRHYEDDDGGAPQRRPSVLREFSLRRSFSVAPRAVDDDDDDGNPLSVSKPRLTCFPSVLGIARATELSGETLGARPASVAGTKSNSTSSEPPPLLDAAVAELNALNHHISFILRQELRKVERFYREQSQLLCGAAGLCIDSAKIWGTMTSSEQKELRASFHSVYFTLAKLKQYCEVNYTALKKFLKKFDKNTSQNTLKAYEDALARLPFNLPQAVNPFDTLRDDMTMAFGKYTLNGDIKLAKQIFHTEDAVDQVQREKLMTTQSGVAGGIAIALGAVTITEFFNAQPVHGYNTQVASYWYGVTFAVLLLPLLFSINVVVWTHFGVNFSFIFDLHATKHWTGLELFRNHVIYLCVWLVSAYAFLRTNYSDTHCGGSPSRIPAWIWPFLIIPLWCVALALQFARNFMRLIPRQEWLLTSLGRMVVTPMFPVMFSEFFIADQLTSLGGVLFEVQFFWCYVHETSVERPCAEGIGAGVFGAAVLPHAWRLMQCCRKYYDSDPETRRPHPHLVNAVKYVSGIVSIVFAFLLNRAQYRQSAREDTLFGVWLAVKCVETIFKIFWDTTMDFGILILQWTTEEVVEETAARPIGELVEPSQRHVRRTTSFSGLGFRHEVLFRPTWVYFVYPFINVLFRLAWVPAIFLRREAQEAEWRFILFAGIEILRRFFWNFFRVENEQVNNLEGYRATQVMPKVSDSDVVGLWDSTLENDERFARLDDVVDELHGVSLGNLSRITRVFALLPEREKVSIMRIADPERSYRGVSGEGKSKRFSELCEATKVHALVVLLGEERLVEYTRRLGFSDVASSDIHRAQSVAVPRADTPDSDEESPVDPADRQATDVSGFEVPDTRIEESLTVEMPEGA